MTSAKEQLLERLGRFPRAELGGPVTPLGDMPRLTAGSHAERLLVKRDDCTGLAIFLGRARLHAPGATLLFVHTGGAPALFACGDDVL